MTVNHRSTLQRQMVKVLGEVSDDLFIASRRLGRSLSIKEEGSGQWNKLNDLLAKLDHDVQNTVSVLRESIILDSGLQADLRKVIAPRVDTESWRVQIDGWSKFDEALIKSLQSFISVLDNEESVARGLSDQARDSDTFRDARKERQILGENVESMVTELRRSMSQYQNTIPR